MMESKVSEMTNSEVGGMTKQVTARVIIVYTNLKQLRSGTLPFRVIRRYKLHLNLQDIFHTQRNMTPYFVSH